MVVKIATKYLKSAPDAQLLVIVNSGISGVKANSGIYTTPQPAFTVLEPARDAFSTAIDDANNGGPAQTAIKNQKRASLVTLMQQFSSYVTITADGNLASLKLSGLPIQKPTRTKVGPLDAPYAPLVLQATNSGSINVIGAPIYGASSYNWQVALASAPDTAVQTDQTPGARTSFDGLTPGQLYLVTVNAVGAAGTSDWSDASSIMVI